MKELEGVQPMEATLTLDQAGRQLGVDHDALSRLIRMGALPEAQQQSSDSGSVWVIPERVLPSVAARNGWTIDLRGTHALVAADGEATTDVTPGVQMVPLPPTVPTRGSGASPVAGATTSMTTTDHQGGPPSVGEVIDLALLDRLLGAQEQRVLAEAHVQEARNALTALNQTHNRVTSELEIERHERMVAADRYREERLARAAADAKVTELRNRVTREMELAEAERRARSEALDRTARAEREAANAVASMGWLARRRYRRIGTTTIDS